MAGPWWGLLCPTKAELCRQVTDLDIAPFEMTRDQLQDAAERTASAWRRHLRSQVADLVQEVAVPRHDGGLSWVPRGGGGAVAGQGRWPG
ncbi:hypothetical protein ABH930_002773 [Kitasatospora sp. GAS204A]|uniref:hypothetical protein n=1 Tax=unclassified Kitasatospora TaxID=2633591 RepID=UPI00247567B9|nr:hypothetical protein [Kitasatospora sp. GAS204B]MDH6118928.1 hypothetical protein [Kitasatospora sp. GAS204B]